MSARSALAMATAVSTAFATTGCYSTWDLMPKGVFQVDGFREGEELKVVTADNKVITYNDSSTLLFSTNGKTRELQFRAIDTDIEKFTLTGIEKEGGAQIIVDLAPVDAIRVRQLSPVKTVAAIGSSVVLGVPALVFTGFAIAIVAGGGIGGGRPLRVAGEVDPVRASLHLDSRARRRAISLQHAHELSRARVFAHWAKEASAECASIPVFLALARDLRKASAPESLVYAALRAAQEEATHTRLCTELANAQTDAPILASTPPTPEHLDANINDLLQRLSLEAFWDGCVAEGAAATVARRSGQKTHNAATSLALQTIAQDEAEHAQLSRDIVAFCLSSGGRSVRQALGESLERKRSIEEADFSTTNSSYVTNADVDADFLAECGVPSDDLLQAARIENWEKSLRLAANA